MMNDPTPAAEGQTHNSLRPHADEHSGHASQGSGGSTVAGFARHTVAIVLGLLLTILGVGLSLTIVLIPIGVPMTVFGGLIFIWGIYDWSNG